MKNNLYKTLVVLILFTLTACQAVPGPTGPADEFFEGQAGRWISVRPPGGWIAKQGGTSAAPNIIVTDDWTDYVTTGKKAIGIIVVPLTDKGSAEQVLQIAVERLGSVLVQPKGQVTLEEAFSQSYAWVEYDGKSAEQNDTPAYYFLAIIATAQRSVLVFSAVEMDQRDRVRPLYQSTLKGITLH